MNKTVQASVATMLDRSPQPTPQFLFKKRNK